MIPITLNTRVEWIDTAKGIGIILVVLGHIWSMPEGYKYINSFHMPLFFFLSGYLVDFEKYDSRRVFIKAKFNHLVIPYLWFSVITYLYWFFIERKFSGNSISPRDACINILMSPGADQYLPHNPALWFLTCLFVVTIAFYGIARRQKIRWIGIVLLISSVVGYTMTFYFASDFLWSADVALTGIVFYGIGFMSKRKAPHLVSSYLRLIVLCCCIPAGFIISQMNGNVVMSDNLYGNYLYFYSGAFIGIINVVIIALFLRKNMILSYLGQNSLIILALHFPIKRVVTSLTSKVLAIPMVQMKESFGISALDTSLTILMLVPIIYIITNKCSFMLGKMVVDNRVVKEVRI